MEKISAKSIMYAVPALLFLLQLLSGLVGAVDIIFYESTDSCGGSGYSFNGIGPQICAEVSAKDGGSVLVTSTAGSATGSQFYRDGGCTTLVATESGNVCVEGGQFTGAFWDGTGRRRSLLGSSSCESTTKPDGVVYTDDGTKGSWILTTSEAADLYSQMQNIPEAEKANWLQSQGAAYYKL